MSEFRIEGGRPLQGTIEVPGSKNACLALLSSVVLAKGQTVLHNVPKVSDVRIKSHILESFGAKVEWREGSLFIDCTELFQGDPDPEAMRAIRTSFYLLGPLLGRLGQVRIPMPGGCKIGARPVDFHLKGLHLLGADIQTEDGAYSGKVGRLKGAEIYLDFPSAGATQHLMATATLAKGITTIQNAAVEPEVVELAGFMNRMGARIEGAGSSTITIMGVEEMRGCEFRVPSDRLQAGTYLLAGAITRGDVTVNEINPETQTALVNKLREAGAEADEDVNSVRVASMGRMSGIKIKTMPYPGFPTDMQQPMAAALTLAEGTSVVEETIYESRIGHIPELNRMGAKIRLEGRSAIISGVNKLRGATVEASDLRAGASLVLAGLAAEGETRVRNIHFIDRGYEDLEQNLRALGANIVRVPGEHAEVA